jgi:hypothetical protein
VLTVHGKSRRVRYLPADAEVAGWIHDQLERVGHYMGHTNPRTTRR